MKLVVSTLTLALAAFAQKPECAKALNAGLEAYQRKQQSEALIAFQSAVECDANFTAAHLAIADVYAERGNETQALASLLRALDIEPKNADALRAASFLYLKNGLHTKAQPLLERLIAVTPGSADAHAELAAIYAASGNRAAAEMQFRKALEINPGFFPALSGLGNLLARSGEQEAALPLLRKAIAVQPKAWEAHFLLGTVLNRLEKFHEARTELDLASKLGGDKEPQVFYQLARACGGLNLVEERKVALARFSELTRKEKESADRQRQANRLIDEARTLLETGDLEGALQRLEEAREARPGDATLLFRLAGLNYDLQRLDAAREYARSAIGISPTTWLYHYLLGLVERASKRLDEAKTSLETAARLGPTQAPVFNALGEVLMAQGSRDAAIAALETACRLAPAEAAFRQNLDLARSLKQ